ncbi:unnamed protein product [Rodentolepis nana]|uniref:Longin domain-containing protein n=1 Tax=Rodentolepis nana TaxID=102285 RepID=A0A0R3TQB6_RODNA|nr:unnamed protein product [Rodentolepis nana]
MGRRYSYPFILNPLKFKNIKDFNASSSHLNEISTLLGTVDVPNRHGNEICFYSSLLIKKMIEAQYHRTELVKLLVNEGGITVKDKNNDVLLDYHFEDLTYVWVHPDEPRILGIICTLRTPNSPNPISRFTAFRMSSKAKKFAYRLQHIYCDYMDRLHRKASFASIIMDDIQVPEEPKRKFADPARMEVYRTILSKSFQVIPQFTSF